MKAENSLNFNAGIETNKKIEKFNLMSSINGFYRMSKDFIRFYPLGPFGQFENLNNINSLGVEFGGEVNWKKRVSLSTNFTFQHITDQSEFDEGIPNDNYLSRVPNLPWLFGNAKIGLSPKLKWKEQKLSFFISTRYVHQFYLTWEKLGVPSDKLFIPAQFIQNFDIQYALKDGRYNISFSIHNILDKRVYDNFNIQKPGRSFSVKFRYLLKK